MAVLEGHSPSLRPDSYSIKTKDANDIIILKINMAGKIVDSYNINHGMAAQSYQIEGIDFYTAESWYVS